MTCQCYDQTPLSPRAIWGHAPPPPPPEKNVIYDLSDSILDLFWPKVRVDDEALQFVITLQLNF